MMTKMIATNELIDAGYLLEANRLFFHPLGLALEVTAEADGTATITGVQDHRDQPEGYRYAANADYPVGGGDVSVADTFEASLKAAKVFGEWTKRAKIRREKLGYVVQPVRGFSDPRDARELIVALLEHIIEWHCGDDGGYNFCASCGVEYPSRVQNKQHKPNCRLVRLFHAAELLLEVT
jgi:hypothetical protein